jgi:TPR repeat protein
MQVPGRLGSIAGILLLLVLPARADFADAARAYDSGDYATAFAEWHALARQGVPAAQIAIASLYRGGIGRPVDLFQAARWYRRAAEQGDAVAQMNLGELYQRGWGVERDLVKALVWYDRAARQGREWAADQRDRLAKEMTEEALAKAKKHLQDRR